MPLGEFSYIDHTTPLLKTNSQEYYSQFHPKTRINKKIIIDDDLKSMKAFCVICISIFSQTTLKFLQRFMKMILGKVERNFNFIIVSNNHI